VKGQNMTEQARPNRAEETKRERRRKPGQTIAAGIKLHVDESKLDRQKYSYRFANDKNGRVQQLQASDWDIAPEGAKDGSVHSTHAGAEEGKPYNAVLMRKPKDWYDEDMKEKQRPLDEMDEAIRRGNTEHKANERIAGAYTPGTNTIERA